MDEPVRPDPAPPSAAAATASVDPSPGRPRTAEPRRLRAPTPRVALVIAGAVVLGIVLYLGSAALGPFIVGLILAYLLDMPVERMSRVGVPRWLSVLVVYAIG